MKQLIGGALALAFGALVLGFWLAPGWTENLFSHALGLPSAEDRNLSSKVNTIVLRDLAANGANCPKVKSWDTQRMEGQDVVAAFKCTSNEAYEVRMYRDRDWTYRRLP